MLNYCSQPVRRCPPVCFSSSESGVAALGRQPAGTFAEWSESDSDSERRDYKLAKEVEKSVRMTERE